jgi:hypothetical protein
MDNEFVIGKNASDNVRLIQESQSLSPLDVWFHLNNYSSAHLIFHNIQNKNMNRLRKDGTIYKMASILKKHMMSKLHQTTNQLHVEIIYSYVKDIKLVKPTGTVRLLSKSKDNIINV